MNRRAEILHELARSESPAEPLMRELGSFGWDWDGPPLLVLTKDDLLRVIDRFLVGKITADQLQSWAENLEVRDDVDFDERERELIDDVFFRIATPEINEALTVESVGKMKNELLQKKANHFPLPTPGAAD